MSIGYSTCQYNFQVTRSKVKVNRLDVANRHEMRYTSDEYCTACTELELSGQFIEILRL